MTVFYRDDNPIKSKSIATMRYDKVGYVREPMKNYWKKSDDEKKDLPTPGIVIEFPWSEDISEENVKVYLASRKDLIHPTMEGPDMFPSSRDYMVYKMFCELMGSHGRILITDENKSSIFFANTANNEVSADTTMIANLLIRLEEFSSMVVEDFGYLKGMLEAEQIERYNQKIKSFKDRLEKYYNEEVLKYSKLNYNFYYWNLIDFIVPKEPFGTWIPDDTDDIKALRESRDKVFGEFSHDENLKKIYFDLYDLCLDGIVDYNWRHAVGEGWKDLVKSAFIRFRDREEESFFWWKRIYAAQIKEKFGLLRIYVDFPADWYFDNVINGKEDELSNEDVEDYIHELEDYSGHICEMCGKHNDEDSAVETRSSFASSWIKTLCQSCRDQKFTKILVENIAKQLSEKN